MAWGITAPRVLGSCGWSFRGRLPGVVGRARDWGHTSTGRSESIPYRDGESVAQSAQGGQGGFDARIGARRWRGGLALRRGGVRRRRPAGGRREIDGPESANCHRVDLRIGSNAGRRAVSCTERPPRRGLVDSHRGLLTHRRPEPPRPGTGPSLPSSLLALGSEGAGDSVASV